MGQPSDRTSSAESILLVVAAEQVPAVSGLLVQSLLIHPLPSSSFCYQPRAVVKTSETFVRDAAIVPEPAHALSSRHPVPS